jgi:long-chain acyl-CoA synthetase
MNNVPSEFFATADRLGDETCAYYKCDGRWKTVDWRGMKKAVLALAARLTEMGLTKGDGAIIFAKTRIEWAIADLAIMSLGAVVVPIYHSFKSERVAHVLKDSNPKLAIIEDEGLLAVFDEALKASGHAGRISILTMDDVPGHMSVASLLRGDLETEANAPPACTDIAPSDVATCVYTSGTTGDLKGVVLTHANLTAEIEGVGPVFRFGPDDVGILWLPLAHVLGRMMELYDLVYGAKTAFVGHISELPEAYLEIRPNFVCSVPRMLEKIYEQAHSYIEHASHLTRWLCDWSISAGMQKSRIIQRHTRLPWLLSLKCAVADVLVFRKLKRRLGGRLTTIVCGGAKLSEDIARFFHAAGISVLEGYGLTETFAAATVNRPDDFHFGTVGKPIPGVSMKLAHDGEVLIKGGIVFKEYKNRPDDTKASFDSGGWFHTGDIGEYSRDGFLRITGRKKELIITAGGKNVAPQMIESMIAKSPYVDHVMLYGDGKKYIVAIISLNADSTLGYLASHGIAASKDQLAEHPAVSRLIQREIDVVNAKLASFETVKRFAITPDGFSVDGGELTPTMKVRRGFVAGKYSYLIDSLYN